MPTSPQRVLFQTTDYDRAGEYLTSAYGTNMRMTGRKVGYSFRFTQLTTATFSVGTAAQTDQMAITVERPASLFVVRPRGTTMDYRAPGIEHQVASGELIIGSTSAQGTPYRVCWLDGVIEATALPFDLVGRVAATERAAPDEPVRFTDVRPHNRSALRHLCATIDYFTDALRDRPAAMAEPLVASTAGQQLCAAVLATFPNTALLEPTIEDRHDSHPRTLRRAIAFIESHAEEDIGVSDIAAATNVTIRALQHAFRRHRDTTPMGYVRTVRLREAHQELLATDPASGVTVTQVAARWGFFHPGRFARYYREVHGCSPYQTLLRDAP
ncbi:AraC family transcriptional regulator [Actinophytocola glycyrrhizae]|uniref:Helix-turn-helix domain-containing protein n=1 Tax=Actinophytocola glycyrrhizae TaxID=2044873 RepID=A0ABV9SA15_9PSEU